MRSHPIFNATGILVAIAALVGAAGGLVAGGALKGRERTSPTTPITASRATLDAPRTQIPGLRGTARLPPLRAAPRQNSLRSSTATTPVTPASSPVLQSPKPATTSTSAPTPQSRGTVLHQETGGGA